MAGPDSFDGAIGGQSGAVSSKRVWRTPVVIISEASETEKVNPKNEPTFGGFGFTFHLTS